MVVSCTLEAVTDVCLWKDLSVVESVLPCEVGGSILRKQEHAQDPM